MTEDKAFSVIIKLGMHQNYCRIYETWKYVKIHGLVPWTSLFY